MTEEPTKQVTPPELRNPNGKGGFGDHPEHINPGGRPKNADSITYWLRFFQDMRRPDFEAYPKEHPSMTMAALAAYARVGKAVQDRKEFETVANRTEGMPRQRVEMGMDESISEVKVEIVRHEEKEEPS